MQTVGPVNSSSSNYTVNNLSRFEVLQRRRMHAQQTRRQRFMPSSQKRTLAAKAGWKKWAERFFRFVQPTEKSNVIPPRLRPWVPKNQHLSENDAYVLAFELKRVCAPAQYRSLNQRYGLEEKAGITA
jgi:hypothetical protein